MRKIHSENIRRSLRALGKMPPPQGGWVTRFAPSPTGYLHLGHVASAIFVWGIAAFLKARVVLRIEDHDQQRSRSLYEEAILADLSWLMGETHQDKSFFSKQGFFRQSDRFERYQQTSERFDKGSLLYQCKCTRRQIQQRIETHGQELRYDGHCRQLAVNAEGDYTLRCLTPDKKYSFFEVGQGLVEQNPWKQCGDLAIRDRAGNWTYLFAVTVDDHEQGINLIIRGLDIFPSTGRQVYLGTLIDNDISPVYFHHPLVYEKEGRKMSKRFLSTAITSHRNQGLPASKIIAQACQAVGLIDKGDSLSWQEAMGLFNG